MTGNIDPKIRQNDPLRDAVALAERELSKSFPDPAEGRSWRWEASDNPGSVKLVMEYFGNTTSAEFEISEFSRSERWVWKAHDLWQDVLLANVRKTTGNILEILREMKQEELAQGA